MRNKFSFIDEKANIANNVEVGAQLEFTRQNINEMIMLRGTAVLSE